MGRIRTGPGVVKLTFSVCLEYFSYSDHLTSNEKSSLSNVESFRYIVRI